MNVISLIREQIKTSHEWFEGTIAGVTNEVAHHIPGGTAHPIGSRYAHLVVSEDMMINGLVKGGAPMFATSWAGKAGVDDPQAAFSTTLEWANTVKVDLDALRQYALAVYDNTDKYMASLSSEDLDRPVDLSGVGMGTWSLGAFLLTFVLGHIRDIMGEVSALKGVQGMQGFPF